MSHNHDHGAMDHSVMDHGHMNHDTMDMDNLGLGLMNSTNMTNLIMQGVKHAAEHLSGLIPDQEMDHSNHMDISSHHIRNPHDDMDMSGMKMYFHFGYDEYILFYGWHINTVGGLIGSMIGIFIMAVLYEGLKYMREFLFKKSISSLQMYAQTDNKPNCPRNMPLQLSMLSVAHLTQTVLHMTQFVLAYFLMLIFMTYNVWLGMACTLGAGFGYFLFGWKKSVIMDVVEHCH